MSKLGEWIIDAASGPFGSNLKVECFVPDGFPIIDGANLKGVIVTDNITKFVPENKARSLSRSIAQRHDVIVTISGTLGQVAYIPEDSKYEEYLCSQRQFRVTFDETLVDVEYLVYYLHTTEGQKKILSFANYVGVPALSQPLPNFKNIEVTFPDVEIQHQVVKAIKMFDSKISLNNAISAELEALAKTLYDYWFVQFDFPDENGKSYKSSGGKMVWNEELKREIPEGWEVKAIAACIQKSKNGDWGKELPHNRTDIGVNCFRGADFSSITSNHIMTAPVRYISAKNIDRMLVNGDLVTEISGGSPTQATGRIGYINQAFLNRSDNFMVCSNFCKAIVPIDNSYQFWLYQTWKMLYDMGIMFNYEGKTTGIKNLMFEDFIQTILLPYPPEKILKEYQSVAGVNYTMIQNIFSESAELASLRDFLLPLLMNGQVVVKDEGIYDR